MGAVYAGAGHRYTKDLAVNPAQSPAFPRVLHTLEDISTEGSASKPSESAWQLHTRLHFNPRAEAFCRKQPIDDVLPCLVELLEGGGLGLRLRPTEVSLLIDRLPPKP